MHRLKVIMALLLFTLCGVSLAGAAGVGTFSIEKTTIDVGVNQFGIATLYMDNTWDPKADDVFIYVNWDPAVLQYVSTDWRVGNSVAATLNSPGELFLQFADWTNQYPSGRVPIADINFRALMEGQTTMGLRIDHVRSHIAASPTNFVDLTPSSLTNPGVFTVGAGGGAVPTVTTLPTITLGPNATGTVAPTVTIDPNVTGTAVPTVTMLPTVTIDPNATFTPVPTLTPIGTVTVTIPTATPIGPVVGAGGGSEEYTGVLSATPTVTAAATTTVTATLTGEATPTTGGTDGSQNIVQIASADANFSTLVSAIQEAGLVETLSGPGPFTVFAPTNAAFEALPPGALDALLQDREELASVLTYHVAAGRITSDNLTATKVIKTVEGQNVNVTAEAGRIRVDGAMVTQTDIQASNGVIHVIDAVMLPPAGNATPGTTATGAGTPGVTPVDTTVPTTVSTTVPVTGTTTAAGLDALPLAVGVLAGIALLIAGRRR